nr:mucin-2-like [Nothobranchius furzeri]
MNTAALRTTTATTTTPTTATFSIKTATQTNTPFSTKAITPPETIATNTATIEVSSVSIIIPTTTTAAPTQMSVSTTTKVASKTTSPAVTTKITTTEAPAIVYVASATIVEPYVPELSDKNSKQFRALEKRVILTFTAIYKTKYGDLFISCYVIDFKPAQQVKVRMEETQADVGLVFSNTVPSEKVPAAKDVQQTLVEAATNTNLTLNITFEPSTIQVLRVPLTTTAATTVTSTTTATTTSKTTPITTSTTSTKTATTSEPTTTRRLTFRSARETFTSDLGNPSSVAFLNRAALIKSKLEPYYQRPYPTFRSLTVVSFSNGSIINNADLRFATRYVPNITEIGRVLLYAAPNVTDFNIDLNYIYVDGIQVSSGVNHQISLLTAACMLLLSWLLSSQQGHLC